MDFFDLDFLAGLASADFAFAGLSLSSLAGFALFRQHYFWEKPVRALTIRGINLVSAHQPVQLDMFCNAEARERRRALDDCVDEIRRRFGNRAICAASLMGDLKMAQDKCETVMMPGLMYQ